MRRLHLLLLFFSLSLSLAAQDTSMKTASHSQPDWLRSSSAKLETELTAKYGESQRARVQLGLRQVSEFWRAGTPGRSESRTT